MRDVKKAAVTLRLFFLFIVMSLGVGGHMAKKKSASGRQVAVWWDGGGSWGRLRLLVCVRLCTWRFHDGEERKWLVSAGRTELTN